MRHSTCSTLVVTASLVAVSMVAPARSAAQPSPSGASNGMPAALSPMSPAATCASMRTLRLPDVRITDVVDVRDSATTREALRPRDNVRGPHCRVIGATGKAIAFEIVMPDQWNQRLYMGGNGGFAGNIARGTFATSNQGYVTVSTNTGHTDENERHPAAWALNDAERQLDYAYVGVHRAAEIAKVIAKAYYGIEPKYSYFLGCSNGGRQALQEAERYPDDFDGIVAGAPAAQFSTIFGSFLKNAQATFPNQSYFDKPVVTQANLDLVAGKILDMCDALDGVKDGVLDDPRGCQFKLASIKACAANKPGDDCLTTAQRAAIARVYAPFTDKAGKVLYPGQPFGGENLRGSWPAWITGSDTGAMRRMQLPNAQLMFLVEGGKYMTFSDSMWDYSKYKVADWNTDNRRFGKFMDADNPDISKFGARNGKLIIWHGWADPALNALGSIDYFEQVRARDAKSVDYTRLVLLPGVLHCAGGNGPAQVPWLNAIAEWVERGKAPEQLIATKRDTTGKVVRTRPVCAYPHRAVYSGSGSTDDAANFACKMPSQ